MKKFLLGVVLSVLFVAQSAFAMTFQQPVKLGDFVWKQVHHNSFEIKGATYNSGQSKVEPRSGRIYYTKGVARFGDGDSAIWLHYNKENRPHFGKLGGENFNNVLSEDFLGTGYEIFFIGEERGFKFYAIRGGYDLPSAQFRYEYDIIGRKPDGTWVKYLNTGKLLKQYIGKDYACSIQNVTTSGNTIIMQYKILEYKLRRVTDGRCGELRFKWDESAQWFGVEHIKY